MQCSSHLIKEHPENSILCRGWSNAQKRVFFTVNGVTSHGNFLHNQVLPRRQYFSLSNRCFYLDVLKHLRDEIDANDLIMDISILDGTFQKGTNSLVVLHYRNLDHDNIPWFANTLFIGFNTQWLNLFPKLNSTKCVRDPLKLQHGNRSA